MPEAVQVWIGTRDYEEVEEVQDRILKDYADDFGKYTTPETATKIRLIWSSIIRYGRQHIFHCIVYLS